MFGQVLALTKGQTFISSLITVLVYVYGLVSTPLFWILIFLSALDFILGVYAAFKNKELDWDKCLNGIANKVFIAVLIVLSALIDFTLMYFGIQTKGLFHNFIMAALLTRELGSIFKNADKANLWMPQLFKYAYEKLKQLSNNKK